MIGFMRNPHNAKNVFAKDGGCKPPKICEGKRIESEIVPRKSLKVQEILFVPIVFTLEKIATLALSHLYNLLMLQNNQLLTYNPVEDGKALDMITHLRRITLSRVE